MDKSWTFSCFFFTENLTLSLPVSRWAGANTNLPSNSNIWKTVRVNITLTEPEYLISSVKITRLINFAIVVLRLLTFKVCGIIVISKIEFLKFFCTKRIKQNQKNLKTIRNFLSLLVNLFSSNFNKSRTFSCFFFSENLILSLPVPC